MKKCIIVPVDFTDIAFDAYCYANELAYSVDASLHLLHVSSGSFETNQPLEIKAGMTHEEMLLEKLKGFARWHPNDQQKPLHPVDTTYQVAIGNIVHQILKVADEKDAFLIVAGTRDKHTLKDKWLGTVSSGVSIRADRPVLLIPYQTSFEKVQNLVVACDYHADNYQVIKKLSTFSYLTRSTLHVVHVKSGEEIEFEYLKEEILDMLRTYADPTLEIKTATLENTDVVTGLYDYASQYNGAMIIMISQKRNFLERLIHRSMSQKAAINAKMPTMVLHVES